MDKAQPSIHICCRPAPGQGHTSLHSKSELTSPLHLTGTPDPAADLLRHMDNPDLLPWRFEGETRGDSEDDVNDTIGAQDLEEDSKELERWAWRCLPDCMVLHRW